MPDLPAEFQDLIRGMLTIDPTQRFTIEQIKEHPAFRCGIPESYIFPKPLPLPYINEPIQPSAIDPTVGSILMTIGEEDEQELLNELMSESHSMVKVFYYMLTTTNSYVNLPWNISAGAVSEESVAALNDVFIVSPPESQIGFSMHNNDVFHRHRASFETSTPDYFSYSEKVSWPQIVAQGECNYEVMQPCIGITIPLETLLMNMQMMLFSNDFLWFHPNDVTIISKHKEIDMFIEVKIQKESESTLDMNLYFTQVDQTVMQTILEQVRCIIYSTD